MSKHKKPTDKQIKDAVDKVHKERMGWEGSKLQPQIDEVYSKAFGSTPLRERLDIIMGEAIELRNFRDVKNLREETGDILTAVIQLATESGWDARQLILENLEKINRRQIQYRSQSRKTRVGIFGGAYNPITIGHVKAMEFILKACSNFDEIWCLPCYDHKFGKDMVSSKHRLAMCRLAVAHNPRLKVFDYEIRNKLAGETYTFVKRLLDEPFSKDKYEFSMIIGLDNANTMDTWVNWKILIDMIPFVVVQRAGIERNKKVNWYLKEPHMYLEQEEDIPLISSTEVRALLQTRDRFGVGRPAMKHLGEEIMYYIENNNLYLGSK
jgi:nicotinate-nucleotide adenylyltransferase